MQVSLQPLSDLVKEYFVPICASCIAVYCSMRSDKEIAGLALNNSILQFGKISEVERDELIKKNMASLLLFSFCRSNTILFMYRRNFSILVLAHVFSMWTAISVWLLLFWSLF